ncbi:hypothetical protein N7454_001711 [Penicillium verhagenii]|nr:hypothetical protein N7454_001711 [Penicillium verhagenii]
MPAYDMPDLDLTQALTEISKGEVTATALENHLTALESKMDEILAAFDREPESIPQDTGTSDRGATNEEGSHIKTEKANR